jgi:D-alanyl-D-alanine dipeptidase
VEAPGASAAEGEAMTILLSDDRVAAVPVVECGEPLVRLPRSLGPARALVRAGVAERLERAQADLPAGVSLRVVEGHRSVADQHAILARYRAQVRAAHPDVDDAELHRLTSRFVAPLAVAPHVAGAAVDLTLVGRRRRELDLGTEIDAPPEQSDGRCYFAADDISAAARRHRDVLARALRTAGLVNYPTEWWHWSFGDRYWALLTQSPAAPYGAIDVRAAA